MRCATSLEENYSGARLTGWCLCLATLLLASGTAYAQQPTHGDGSYGGDPSIVLEPAASLGCGPVAPGQASCDHNGVPGGSDYSAALSAACESCTSSSVGSGGVPGLLSPRPRPGVRLLDYVFGDSCEGSGCPVDGNCGRFWNHLASGQMRSTAGLARSIAARARSASGLVAGGGVLRGGCGVLGCASGVGCGPGAGYVGHRPPPVRCGMPAPTYPVPYPVPRNVGYTRFTYPPMMPHHSLPHYRRVYSYFHSW